MSKNREIKYRAWDGKRIIYNVDLLHTYRGVAICNELDFENDKATCSLLGDYPVMQYTGLKDKNGKEIYEGDIVRYETNYYGNHKVHTDTIEWCDDLEHDGFGEPLAMGYLFRGYNIEVIGNIYQDSHLLRTETRY